MFNKSWVNLNRATKEYMEAAWDFVKIVEKNDNYPLKIICPCKNCWNLYHQSVDDVYEHLVIKGMDPTYRVWVHHGEQPFEKQLDSELDGGDAFNLYMAGHMDSVNDDISVGHGDGLEKDFDKNLEDAETPFYTGCGKYTKLSAILILYKLKNLNGWTDTSFNDLLELLHDMLPENNVLLNSTYSAKRFLRKFDLKYQKDRCLCERLLFV
ncbi:hypothetical protein UlMin_006160 [Ulmus minor]